MFTFSPGKGNTGNTRQVWIYDLRSNMPAFGKRTPLARHHFANFEKAFGSDPYGKSKREDEGEQGRFRCFSREYIRAQGETLDITWSVSGEAAESKVGQAPDALASQIRKRLESALKELRSLQRGTKRKD